MKTLLALVALVTVAGCATTPDRVETARDVCSADYGGDDVADRQALSQCVRLALRRAEARDRAEARRSSDRANSSDRSSQIATGVAMQQIGRSMSDYGASLSRPSVTCTTLGFGSFAQTTCR